MKTEEQLSPDQVGENELICEKLLGWHPPGGHADIWWHKPNGRIVPKDEMPSFTTWAEAGLILDVLQRLSYDRRTAADVILGLGDQLIGALLTPAAIRAAALEYIKVVKS